MGATPKKEREDERERKKERKTIVKRGGKVSKVENEGPPFVANYLLRRKQKLYIKKHPTRV